MSGDAKPPPSAGPPPIIKNIELPPKPPHDGNILELSLGKLTSTIGWMYESIDLLLKGLEQVNQHLEMSADMWKRLQDLENRPPPTPVTVVQERAKTPPRPPTPQKIEIPYVPSEEERAEEARRACRPMLDDAVNKLQSQIDDIVGKMATLEEFASKPNPWDRMQVYMQEIGFLPYGEPEEKDPLVLLGQVCVLLRQDIAMCPRIKDLEDAKDSLNARINEVESEAAADRKAKALDAAAESAKIREDLERVDAVVQGLVKKNLEDGDVAGGLRDLLLRVDGMEERRFPKLEMRVRALEELERGTEGGSGPRKKGFLEELAEVDVEEEIRRLRTVVECMEAAMPYETRQTMQFFKDGGKISSQAGTQRSAGSPNATRSVNEGMTQLPTSPMLAGGSNSADLMSLRNDTEQQLERFR